MTDLAQDPSKAPVPMWRVALRFALAFPLLGLLIFGSAGTLGWPEAWVYLIGQFIFSSVLVLWLNRHDPDLLRERMRFMKRTGKKWDKPIVIAFSVLSVALYTLPGLDAVRYHWSHVPLLAQLAALVGVAAGSAIVFRVMQVNTFLTPIVEIQHDRRHTVVNTGPYAYVRHPMYAGMTLLLISFPLFLGSMWGLVPTALILALLFVRTALEDRTLHRELEGYADYARRVRYRMVPWIW